MNAPLPPFSLAAQLQQIEERSLAMKRHSVFSSLQRPEDLHVFMQWHVFAVWDFMSLVKRLQLDLTCVSLPWVPPASPRAARLINEIVLGEESDCTPDGGHASHFELYLAAMEEVGADTRQIRQFVELIRNHVAVPDALRQVNAPLAVRRFVESTIDLAINGLSHQVLGSFLHGREDVIPEMFRRLLAQWRIEEKSVPTFVFYLNRHIEVDSESHGPAAHELVREFIGADQLALTQMHAAALGAVEARIALWTALEAELVAQRRQTELAAA
ncbi:DUF3050 domain-containing protein [Derxia lacustris]|uniref:DUF3050 domain-containing protein n=1 Tax=Derxia lacustris TaxID=764842 RepID=UPI001F368F1E|nr:DUF3050 domain-containing protein [Derxia lacustris]